MKKKIMTKAEAFEWLKCKKVYANGKDSLPERSIAFIAHKLRYDEDVYGRFYSGEHIE